MGSNKRRAQEPNGKIIDRRLSIEDKSAEVSEEDSLSSDEIFCSQETNCPPSPFRKKKDFKQVSDKNLVTNPKAGSPSKRRKLISPDKIRRNPPRKYSNTKSMALNDKSGGGVL